MRQVLVEAFRIVIVACCLGATLGIVRGLPDTRALRRADATACTAPIAARPEILWIDQEDARDLVDDQSVTFVDARARSEYEAGHVLGALSIPMDSGAIGAHAFAPLVDARTVITYCDTIGECASSRRLAELLADSGYRDVRVLRGGMPDWIEHGFPAEAGPCRMCP